MATLYFRIKHTTYAVDTLVPSMEIPDQVMLASTAVLRLMDGELTTIRAIETASKKYYANMLRDDILNGSVVKTSLAALLLAVRGKGYIPINNDGVPFHKAKWRTVRQHFFLFNNKLYYYWGRLDHVHFTATWLGYLTEDGLVDLADYGEEYQSLAHQLYQSGDYEVLTSIRPIHNGSLYIPQQVATTGSTLIPTGMSTHSSYAIGEDTPLKHCLNSIYDVDLAEYEEASRTFHQNSFNMDIITLIRAADRLALLQKEPNLHICDPVTLNLDLRTSYTATVVSRPAGATGYSHYISLAKCPTPANQ